MGFVDAKLASALMNWLSPRLESCGGIVELATILHVTQQVLVIEGGVNKAKAVVLLVVLLMVVVLAAGARAATGLHTRAQEQS